MAFKVYWWRDKPNFGDLLSSFVVEKLLAITPEWAQPVAADAVVIGSVIDQLPADWHGIIAGAGKLHESAQLPRNATVLGVRGLLTGAGLSGDVVYGDPGLLVDELIVDPAEKIHDLGVVPHWSDGTLAARFAYLHPFVIDPTWAPDRVVTAIGSCKKIVSSSLHGIVVADAFGIPRRAEMFPSINSIHEGGLFKFADYASGIDFPMTFGKLQSPPRTHVEKRQTELFEMIRDLGNLIDAA